MRKGYGKKIFRRKIYDALLKWKDDSHGKSAVLVEGARRVGKSTIVEQFARDQYESYILIDFNQASRETKMLFDDLTDLDYIFLTLQASYHTSLTKRKSVIVFDEVQNCPKARQAIKYLVADGRYDYIEIQLTYQHPEEYGKYHHSQRRGQNNDASYGFRRIQMGCRRQ